MKRTIVITTILCGGLLLGGNIYRSSFAQDEIIKQNNTVQEVISLPNEQEVINLTKEDALNILLDYNNLNYLYQGDECGFEFIQQKGLSGYIYLPDIDTDIGYFVDKNTKEIYYFHPDGYLELVI